MCLLIDRGQGLSFEGQMEWKFRDQKELNTLRWLILQRVEER